MRTISYARHRFPPDIIQHAIWLYLRFTLSYRDVEIDTPIARIEDLQFRLVSVRIVRQRVGVPAKNYIRQYS